MKSILDGRQSAPWERAPRAARIVCLYRRDRESTGEPGSAMNHIRLRRMADALARRGHEVDLLVVRSGPPVPLAPRLRAVSFADVRWDDYDAVKTEFHRGWDALRGSGGADHPFVISKLGSVVGRGPTAGVHFHGEVREELYRTQLEIAAHSRSVTVLTEASADLWRREHGSSPPLMLVPTGVDAEIPPVGPDPYAAAGIEGPVVLYAGNLYDREHQPDVNRLWQEQLNGLGRRLRARGLALVAMGTGDPWLLDPRLVRHLGPIPLDDFWDYQRHARAGIVLAQGPFQDNESSKIYYYLRTGLPVICEAPVPNTTLIDQVGCGAIVPFGDVAAMADAVADWAARPIATADVVAWTVRHHSWDVRAASYDEVLAEAAALGGRAGVAR